MKKLVFACLLLLVPQSFAVPASREDTRILSGIIYFTNNTPRDVHAFPVELFTPDQQKRLATTTPDAQHNFSLRDIEPGEYILKFTWPEHCVLRYRVDVRKESKTRIRVIMDAACAHDNEVIRDLDEN